MPEKVWYLSCCDAGALTPVGPESAECPACKSPGVCLGWSITSVEEMARYQNNYGLKPCGPHRAHASRILAAQQIACSTCDGNSILTKPEDDTWFLCPSCAGAGIVWKIPSKQVEALRRKVLKAFPSAEAIRLSTSPIGTGLVPDQVHADSLSNRIDRSIWTADHLERMARWIGPPEVTAYILMIRADTIRGIVDYLKQAGDWNDYHSWLATPAEAKLGPVSGSRHVH